MKMCFLCGRSENVIEFNEESLQKCKIMLLFRQKMNFKYSDIFFNSDTMHGYHLQCYKKFIVLKEKYKEVFFNYFLKQNEESTTFRADVGPSTSIINNENNMDDDEILSSSNILSKSDHSVDLSTNLEYEGLNEESPSTSISVKPIESSVISTVQNVMPIKKLPCIFCNAVEKRVGNRRIYVSFPKSDHTIDGIKKISLSNNDIRILEILQHKERVVYHGLCLTSYRLTKKKISTDLPEPTIWHENRALHKQAFDSLSVIITNKIIEKRKVMFLLDLFNTYKALLMELKTEKVSIAEFKNYRVESLELKIINSFSKFITIENSPEPHKKKIVYNRDISISELATETANLQNKEVYKLESTAYELRNCIKSINIKKLPEKLTAEDVISGECEISEKLFHFMRQALSNQTSRG